MQREKDKIEDLFKESFANYELKPDEHLWNAISADLDLAEKAALERKHKLRKAILSYSSVAALLAICFTLFTLYLPENRDAISVNTTTKSESLKESRSAYNNISAVSIITKPAAKSSRLAYRIPVIPASYTDILKEEPNNVYKDNVIGDSSSVFSKRDTILADKKMAENVNISNEYYDDVFKDLEPVHKRRGLSSAGLFINSTPSSNSATLGGYQMSSAGNSALMIDGKKNPVIERISDIKYSIPVSFGVQGQIKIDNLVSVGFGVRYTFLNSKYDGLIDKKFYHIKQTLHYIGIPVNVYFSLLQSSKIKFYGNAGGTIEKGLRQKVQYKSYDETIRTGCSISGVQFSVNAGFGLEFMLNHNAGLYIEPNAVYYFNSDIPASIRTNQPFQIDAEVGVRYHF